MTQYIGRSPLQQAEDELIITATPVFNTSMARAARYQVQLRELGREERIQAEALLEEWEGTYAQMRQVNILATTKRYAVRQHH